MSLDKPPSGSECVDSPRIQTCKRCMPFFSNLSPQRRQSGAPFLRVPCKHPSLTKYEHVGLFNHNDRVAPCGGHGDVRLQTNMLSASGNFCEAGFSLVGSRGCEMLCHGDKTNRSVYLPLKSRQIQPKERPVSIAS